VYEGALTWEIDGSADIESRGELRWSSRNIPAEEARAIVAELPPAKRPAHLELAPDPAHLLLAIARAPFPAG
jgi:hypothetical protein